MICSCLKSHFPTHKFTSAVELDKSHFAAASRFKLDCILGSSIPSAKTTNVVRNGSSTLEEEKEEVKALKADLSADAAGDSNSFADAAGVVVCDPHRYIE